MDSAEAIESIADKIVKRRLETPAVFLLEANKPVSFIAGQYMLVFDPMLAPFLGEYSTALSEILSDRNKVDGLIARIREKSRGAD